MTPPFREIPHQPDAAKLATWCIVAQTEPPWGWAFRVNPKSDRFAATKQTLGTDLMTPPVREIPHQPDRAKLETWCIVAQTEPPWGWVRVNPKSDRFAATKQTLGIDLMTPPVREIPHQPDRAKLETWCIVALCRASAVASGDLRRALSGGACIGSDGRPSLPHRRGFCFCVFDEEPLLPPRRYNSAATTTAHPHARAGHSGDGSRCCGVDGEPWDGEPRRCSAVAHKPTPASRRKDSPGPRECFIRRPDPPPPPPPPLPNLAAAAMSSDGVVQVVEESDACSDAPDSFSEDADLGAEVLSILVVLGTPASEKSTLYNVALGTALPVAARRAPGALPPAASPQQRLPDTPPYSNSSSRAAPPAPAAA
jgi:hypothetical protein